MFVCIVVRLDSKWVPILTLGDPPFTPNSGFTLGTPVFAHYTSARRWYAPHDLAKINNIEIERVTKMDI